MTKERKRTVLVFIGTAIFNLLSWWVTILLDFKITLIKWMFIYLIVTTCLAAHIEIEKFILKKINHDNP